MNSAQFNAFPRSMGRRVQFVRACDLSPWGRVSALVINLGLYSIFKTHCSLVLDFLSCTCFSSGAFVSIAYLCSM